MGSVFAESSGFGFALEESAPRGSVHVGLVRLAGASSPVRSLGARYIA
jgi:hypothetical protein